MLVNIFRFLYQLIKGQSLKLDANLPSAFFIHKVIHYGLLFIKHPIKRIFISKNVTILNSSNVRIGRYSQIKTGVFIDGYSLEPIVISCSTTIGEFTLIKCTSSFSEMGKGLKIGYGVGIGSFSYLGCGGGITIGDNTIIGERLTIHSDNHNFIKQDVLIKLQGVNKMPVSIGENCWIGSNVTILGGVTIGNGCVIGAGSIVTKSIESNSIAVGNPCVVIKTR